ncbi:disulfide bond formation protein B [Enterovirga aerilata]|uniref:Disulfide bond formation protein B n=1 Tax=Enterovirga aerilata TaxID=2730920 RepID=A0A849HXZ7_9HYPH|nr:disulfide bond formation protein B [Enterovirga sp. DB1703]NNM71982.1 disulfide bond formation protein B [Enterovirga sp. DB1703]
MLDSISPRRAAAAVLALALATIGGALVSEHVLGLVPCKLCLWQRQPYYWGIPLALLVAVAPASLLRPGLVVLALVFLGSAGLGAYHAGVEWGWFLGPSDCGGGTGEAPGAVGDFLKQLDDVRVVSCTEAAWRLLGLSLAGWNVLASLLIAAIAAMGAIGPQGSSSVSQYR